MSLEGRLGLPSNKCYKCLDFTSSNGLAATATAANEQQQHEGVAVAARDALP